MRREERENMPLFGSRLGVDATRQLCQDYIRQIRKQCNDEIMQKRGELAHKEEEFRLAMRQTEELHREALRQRDQQHHISALRQRNQYIESLNQKEQGFRLALRQRDQLHQQNLIQKQQQYIEASRQRDQHRDALIQKQQECREAQRQKKQLQQLHLNTLWERDQRHKDALAYKDQECIRQIDKYRQELRQRDKQIQVLSQKDKEYINSEMAANQKINQLKHIIKVQKNKYNTIQQTKNNLIQKEQRQIKQIQKYQQQIKNLRLTFEMQIASYHAQLNEALNLNNQYQRQIDQSKRQIEKKEQQIKNLNHISNILRNDVRTYLKQLNNVKIKNADIVIGKDNYINSLRKELEDVNKKLKEIQHWNQEESKKFVKLPAQSLSKQNFKVPDQNTMRYHRSSSHNCKTESGQNPQRQKLQSILSRTPSRIQSKPNTPNKQINNSRENPNIFKTQYNYNPLFYGQNKINCIDRKIENRDIGNQNQKSNYFKNSMIIASQTQKLIKMLKEINFKKQSLIFRGTRDGMSMQQFHSKCDNKPNLLYLVENEFGFKYGGYSPCPISIDRLSEYETDKSMSSFVFSLDLNKKAKIVKKKYAISNGHKYEEFQLLVLFGIDYPCSLVIGANSLTKEEQNWIAFYQPNSDSSYQTSANPPSNVECRGTLQPKCKLREFEVYQLTL